MKAIRKARNKSFFRGVDRKTKAIYDLLDLFTSKHEMRFKFRTGNGWRNVATNAAVEWSAIILKLVFSIVACGVPIVQFGQHAGCILDLVCKVPAQDSTNASVS